MSIFQVLMLKSESIVLVSSLACNGIAVLKRPKLVCFAYISPLALYQEYHGSRT